MSGRQDTLIEKERQRSAREALNIPDNNRNVFSSQQERWEEISNTSMRIGHQLQRAVADKPPRAAGQHLNTDQRVNDRLAGLGEEATTRRSGGQGVYPSYYNDNQFTGDNQYMSQPNFNSQPNHNGYMPVSHGNQLQGECPSAPMKRFSSGRDRTGNDGIARLFVRWPNEHCLIGIDRRKVKYDQLTHPQWQAGLMNILTMERNPLCRKTMLNHITRLSQDVVHCGFCVAKGAHAAVLVALEEGRVSWMEPEAIEGIRRDSVSRVYFEAEGPGRSSFTPGASTVAKPKSQGTTKTHSVCKHYNSNTCSHEGDHISGNVLYQHVCTYCRANGKSYPHTELACNKKQQNASNRDDNS